MNVTTTNLYKMSVYVHTTGIIKERQTRWRNFNIYQRKHFLYQKILPNDSH